MSARLSVHLERNVHCDDTVHCSADLSLWLDSPMSWHQNMSTYPQLSFSSSTWKTGGEWIVQCSGQLGTKACPPTPSRPFPVPPGREVGYECTGQNQGQGTVLWFRYVFLKQYCELKGQGSGRGTVVRLVGGEHMDDAVCGRHCCC